MKNLSVEFKVGLFVILAVVLVSMIVFQIGGINILRDNRYSIHVIFDFVSGITIDAPVHFAGVAVGQVKEVAIFYDELSKKTQVRLRLAVNPEVRIPRDSTAYINTLGILGEKYVEIVPGRDRNVFLADGEIILGNNPVQLEKLTESLVDVVGDQTVRDSLRQSFYNTQMATENLLAASENLKQITADVHSGRGTLGRLLHDDSIYEQLDEAIPRLAFRLEALILNLDRQLSEIMADIRKSPWKLLQRPPRNPRKQQTPVTDDGF